MNNLTYKNTYRKKKGMSLFELLFSLVLISVVLTMGFKSYDDYIVTQDAKSGAEQISGAIQKAKYYARTKGVVTSLNLPEGGSSFSVTADGNNISDSSLYGSMSGKLPGNTLIIQNSCSSLNFYIDGSPVDAENSPISTDCTIKVGSPCGSVEKTLTIKGNSGNVVLEQ